MESMPKDVSTGWQAEARRVADGIRLRVLEHTIKNNGGYMSQACSSAEILAVLYTHLMNLGPSQAPPLPRPFTGVPGKAGITYFSGAAYNGPKEPGLDRFIFSPAHYALVLYSVLIETGRLAPEALLQFNQDGSTLEMIGAEHSPGVEVTCGSLGQNHSQAAGIALARKLKGETGKVWVFMSDGEFQEGQTWEVFQAMAHYHLDNMVIYVDVNGQQCDGKMTTVMNIEPIQARLEAFGIAVWKVDGHDGDSLAAPMLQPAGGVPRVVLAYTDPCARLEILRERAPKLHYLRFKNEAERQRYQAAYQALLEVSPFWGPPAQKEAKKWRS
jgi:transketolase